MRLNAKGLVQSPLEANESDDLNTPAIAIIFPAFNDGRGFTKAIRLRKAGYTGILVAKGHLIPDQFAYAMSVGFDEIEVSDKLPLSQWLDQLARREVSYQLGAVGQNILNQRHAL